MSKRKKRAERRAALPYTDAHGIVHVGDKQLAVCGLTRTQLAERFGEPDDAESDGSGFAALRWELPNGDFLSIRMRDGASDFVTVHFRQPVRKRTLLARSGVTDLQRAPGHDDIMWESPMHGMIVGLDRTERWALFVGFEAPWDPRKRSLCKECGHAHEGTEHERGKPS
jgi:hypothetical protein